ncbi:MAG: hypothetical protein RJB31_1860, partial [Bacteroidota bacterium]
MKFLFSLSLSMMLMLHGKSQI